MADTGVGQKTSRPNMTKEVLGDILPELKIPITNLNKVSCCIDGRPGYQEEHPVVAFPGGDAGAVVNSFAALTQLLSEEELNKSDFNYKVLDAVIKTAGGSSYFKFHTDQDNEDRNEGCGKGCGHINNALKDPDQYLVRSEQMQFLFGELLKLKHLGEEVVLQGQHLETGIVLVRSDKFGLKHSMDHKIHGLQQVFVYHETLHNEYMDRLSRNLAEAFSLNHEVMLGNLNETFGRQLWTTRDLLAPGRPIFVVNISDDGEFEISDLEN